MTPTHDLRGIAPAALHDGEYRELRPAPTSTPTRPSRRPQGAPAEASPTLAHALGYALTDGLAVFPVEPGGKRPLARLAPRGVRDATTNPETIKAWWTAEPTANIGVAVGGDSGVAVLDPDGPEGAATLAALEADLGALPPTMEVTTGRGRHLYLRAADVRNSAGKLGPGLDVRGTGGYVVGAGSVHASGHVYTRLAPGQPIAELPAAWIARLGTASAPLAEASSAEGVIPAGQRNDALTRLAGTLRRHGLETASIAAALASENQTRCRPPLPAREVEAIARSVMRYEPGDPYHAPDADAPSSWAPIDLVAAALNPPPPPDLLGLFYRGARHWLTGESESGKSWVALALAVSCVADGLRVVYVDLEMGAAETLKRLRYMGRQAGVTDAHIADLVAYIEPAGPLPPASLAAIIESGPALVIVDACAGILGEHGWSPNEEVDIEALDRTILRPLKRAGACVAVVDHPVKSTEARGRYASGSQRKLSAADVQFTFRLVQPFGRGRAGWCVIHCAKDRGGYLATRRDVARFDLAHFAASDTIAWALEPTGDDSPDGEFRPTGLMERVSRFLEAAGESQSRTQIERGVVGNAKYVRDAIDRLADEGHIVETDGPRSARLCTLTTPFRDAD